MEAMCNRKRLGTDLMPKKINIFTWRAVAIEEATEGGIFNSVHIGNDSLRVSHLQFADDANFLGEWSYMNLKNLLRILRCFHLASGLKVNLSKSALYGVGVDRNEVDWMASTLKCTPGSLPFNYLGLPVGANMSIGCHWSPIIDKVQKRLSSWKARCLSIGGRLTLVKSVLGGSAEDRKISWVAWKQIMADCSMGGLGIGSLSTSNLGLLGKWWWRFHTEPDALWRQVISSIHGSFGGFYSNRESIKGSGLWINILKAGWKINDSGVLVFHSLALLSVRLYQVPPLGFGKMCGSDLKVLIGLFQGCLPYL
ncbi:RNA-directed DNA polymerase, eukaryota, Reverse transcriptase zinc-binding domain protein [Artemisia annua]|uniref:RNA-directed DNA polymerase, eukaryota, Reverse transcriptase zinc-binding domain protein n=1 Tax=Artemisia annua TaxID=35608 RepID=A0A2U1QN38_ARTAN|nr:RNA-directed DNA polymerase, eukaryota, Reverse transcriptase zinc-binding domain protein [Artemisia annua]